MSRMVAGPTEPWEGNGFERRIKEDRRGIQGKHAQLADLPLDRAKTEVGRAVRAVITKSGEPLKSFGDPGRVCRVCEGDVPEWLARIFACPNTRREFVIALAQADPQFTVETTIKVVA